MWLAGSVDGGASVELESGPSAVHAVDVAVQTDLAIPSLPPGKEASLVAVSQQQKAQSCSSEGQANVLPAQTEHSTHSSVRARSAACDESASAKLHQRTDSSDTQAEATSHDSQQHQLRHQRHGDSAEGQPQMVSHAQGLPRADAKGSGPQQPCAAGQCDRLQDDASSHQRQPGATYSHSHPDTARTSQAQFNRGSAESTKPSQASRRSDDALLRQTVALQDNSGAAQATQHSTRVSQEARRKAEAHWTQGLVLPEQLSVSTLAKHAGVDKAFMQVCTAFCAVCAMLKNGAI